MRPFIMSEAQRREIAALKKYAEDHLISVDEMMKVYKRLAPPAGHRPEYFCIIPIGYKAVFTIEAHSKEYEEKGIWARHLSVSVANEKKMPNEYVITELMPLFGFLSELGSDNCVVYDDEGAFNTIEYFNIHDNTLYSPPAEDRQGQAGNAGDNNAQP